MTHTYYTKKILNIEDENIYFYENCLEMIEINTILLLDKHMLKIMVLFLHLLE